MTKPTYLSTKEQINLGSFYTADFLVNEVYAMLKKHIDSKDYVLLDSSCGSGNFLRTEAIIKSRFPKDSFSKIIGADIDKMALHIAKHTLDSKGYFSIIIVLYKRDNKGMDYKYICNFIFKTIDGKEFSLNNFDYIGNSIDKYPNKKCVEKS